MKAFVQEANEGRCFLTGGARHVLITMQNLAKNKNVDTSRCLALVVLFVVSLHNCCCHRCRHVSFQHMQISISSDFLCKYAANVHSSDGATPHLTRHFNELRLNETTHKMKDKKVC